MNSFLGFGVIRIILVYNEIMHWEYPATNRHENAPVPYEHTLVIHSDSVLEIEGLFIRQNASGTAKEFNLYTFPGPIDKVSAFPHAMVAAAAENMLLTRLETL